ncbi:hypothetical protein VISI1226_11354 [Vibrio sinaloensis DSM 21326]|uniref:Uncharacterized protein n=1 Tax=Vibrio sinaloensis DSM 21326 TaxID=945550 RepID=E8M3S2_PHOS4|nr:hypothetical protein VISI1226_11354 [Vibrio sinaloensis DSM 21326]
MASILFDKKNKATKQLVGVMLAQNQLAQFWLDKQLIGH